MDGYYYGPNEDGTGCWEGSFASRKEAEDAARNDYAAMEGEDRPTHFYTARAVPHVPRLDHLGEYLVECLRGRLLDPPFEEDGPWDDWPPATPEDWARLDAMVSWALETWLDERALWPSWCVYQDFRRHEMDEGDGPDHILLGG